MKNTPLSLPAVIAALTLLTAQTLLAQDTTYTWTGNSTVDFNWNQDENWNLGTRPANSVNSHVVFNNSHGMGGNGSTVRFSNTQTIGSMTIDMQRFTLLGTATRILRIGDAATAGRVTLTSAFTDDVVLFSNGPTPRLQIEAASELTFAHYGSGEALVNRTFIQGASSGASPATIYFIGSGSWGFQTNSSIGRQNTPDSQAVNVVLGTASDNYSGTLTYASNLSMDVDSLTVNSGTFRLQGTTDATTLKASTGIFVGTLGTLSAAGIIEGDLSVAGNILAGSNSDNTPLQIDGNLTLNNSATMHLQVSDLITSPIIAGTGVLNLGGAILLIDINPDEYESVMLYSGFSSVAESFARVDINGTSLSNLGGSLWGGVSDNYQWSFNEESGLLSSTAIPEARTLALSLATVVAGCALLHRKRKIPDR